MIATGLHWRRGAVLVGLGLGLVSWAGACRSTEPLANATPKPSGVTVFFSLDAPLCSSIIPMEFFIDSVRVGSDTFRVNIAPEHTTSRGFSTAAGAHTLGARASIGSGYYVWPDTSLTLAPGAAFTKSLPFYCS